jgi:hypothetical protein
MATADYWSSADLKALPDGGTINEDVMQQIIDILDITPKFTGMISSDSVKNSYTSWTKYTHEDPDLTNAAVDGEDLAQNDAKGGVRVGNHCQISKKGVEVTTRARNSDVIGTSDEYSEQIMRQTSALRRDVEAISLSNQASIADNGDTVAGKSAGFNAWLTTNTVRGVGGLDGGYGTTSPTIVDAATLGTTVALSEEAIRDICQQIYEQGFDANILMARPTVIRRISEYMFTDAARIGIQQTETGKSGASTAIGSVKIFITDFDVELVMCPNRLMPAMDEPTTALNDSVFIFDPSMWRHGFLHNYRTESLAKLGLADRSQIAVDWTLKCLAEESAGVVADVDAALAMLAVPA